jgi:3'-phosphoadenosine 5'-phosphosulfate sulfotransferase (PAPS reductase)/FAD synthetase
MSALHALSCVDDADFVKLDAGARVDLALRCLPGAHALSSSFGAQAAVMLHLVNERAPGIPVILVDTGYLFPETYQFIDTLTERSSSICMCTARRPAPVGRKRATASCGNRAPMAWSATTRSTRSNRCSVR